MGRSGRAAHSVPKGTGRSGRYEYAGILPHGFVEAGRFLGGRWECGFTRLTLLEAKG
ncbi:MAG TPA: hypothetical protein VHS29_02955 [Candidatus Acidoferrales bacterium]|nr:hypothetical protein [Candidatus Acidoferrales bacterium]